MTYIIIPCRAGVATTQTTFPLPIKYGQATTRNALISILTGFFGRPIKMD